MTTKQGDLSLLNDPVAQKLLQSTIPARLAYIWNDGTPRVVPIWFDWNGKEVVVSGPADAPKMEAIRQHPDVALTIDDASAWPYKVLLIRGKASVDVVDGVAPEYARAAERYFGPEQGKAWTAQVAAMLPKSGRVKITPTWVGILDFEQRFPNALERAMEAAQGG